MAFSSQFFKIDPNKKSSGSTTFLTKKVQKWIDSTNTSDYLSELEIIEESDDIEEDEMEWNEVELPLKTRPRIRCDFEFIRPEAPKTQNVPKSSKAPKPKIFTPTILFHNIPEEPHHRENSFSLTECSQMFTPSSLNSSHFAIYSNSNDFNTSSNSVDNYNSLSTAQSFSQSEPHSSEYVNQSFVRIGSLLDSIQSVVSECHSVAEDSTQRLTQISTCSESNKYQDVDQSYPSQDNFTFYNNLSQNLKLPYNENSISLLLAFEEPHRFIKLIHEENKRFESEETIEDYINSQVLDSQQDFTIKVDSNLDFNVAYSLPSQDMMLQKGLNRIIQQEDFTCNTDYQRPSMEIAKDTFTIRYRKIFAELSNGVDMTKKLKILTPRVSWQTTVYKDGVLSLRQDFERPQAVLRTRGNMVLYLLRKINSLMVLKTQLTQRSIYYQIKSLLEGLKKKMKSEVTQIRVSDALSILCNMLNMPYWNLGISSTSKGLIYGPLTLTIGTTDIQCNAQNGTTVPMDLNNLRMIKSDAYFILIVEKDTVFQKLLVDDLPNKLSRNFIIITGKGYPDVTTRRLLNILWKLLGIPMFIVVDADAYGVDIFLTYKFGSLNHCNMSQHLALPKLKWLGVLPSELQSYDIKTLPLQANDIKKLKLMLKRPYFQENNNPRISHEIRTLIAGKKKCEIEGLYKSNLFFSNVYMPTKLYKRSYV